MVETVVLNLDELFSKYGPQSTSISTTWEFIKNENSGTSIPDLLNQRLEVRTAIGVLASLVRDSDA